MPTIGSAAGIRPPASPRPGNWPSWSSGTSPRVSTAEGRSPRRVSRDGADDRSFEALAPELSARALQARAQPGALPGGPSLPTARPGGRAVPDPNRDPLPGPGAEGSPAEA